MFKRSLTIALLSASAIGCEPLDRTRQCRELAEVVNPELEAIDRIIQSGKRDPQTIELVAERYRLLSERAQKSLPASQALAESAKQYVELLKDAGRVTRSLSEALRATDNARVEHEKHELERLARQQRFVATQLAGMCRSMS